MDKRLGLSVAQSCAADDSGVADGHGDSALGDLFSARAEQTVHRADDGTTDETDASDVAALLRSPLL